MPDLRDLMGISAAGAAGRNESRHFASAVHKHQAAADHFELRLEPDGVLARDRCPGRMKVNTSHCQVPDVAVVGAMFDDVPLRRTFVLAVGPRAT